MPQRNISLSLPYLNSNCLFHPRMGLFYSCGHNRDRTAAIKI
nr:MAG TPA_asm: hypothetical protein [Caudoviricetes sp.]